MTEQEIKNLEMSELNNHMYANNAEKMDSDNSDYDSNYHPPFKDDGTINDAIPNNEGNQVIVGTNEYTVEEEIHGDSGLDAYIVESSDGETTLSIQGTGAGGNKGADAASDVDIGTGNNPQTDELIGWLEENPSYVNEIDNVTGHSLGGGVGIDISIYLEEQGNHDFNSYIYDPAPFTINDPEAIKALQERMHITIYDEEILSSWVNSLGSLEGWKQVVADLALPELAPIIKLLTNGLNPADYFHLNKIVGTGLKAPGKGVFDHGLGNIVSGSEDGSLDDLAIISFSKSPSNNDDDLKLNEEEEKVYKAKELVEHKEELEVLQQELASEWDNIEQEIGNMGMAQRRKVTSLHRKIMSHLRSITGNEDFEGFATKAEELYDQIEEMATEQQYNNIQYEKDFYGSRVQQIVDNEEYEFADIDDLKQKAMANHKEVEALVKEIIEFAQEYKELDPSYMQRILDRIQDSQEEFDDIQRPELEFSANMCGNEMTEDVSETCGKQIKSLNEAADQYIAKCEEISDSMGEMSHCIGDLEYIICENEGAVFFQQYEALEDLYNFFYKKGSKCIEEMNRFEVSIARHNQGTQEADDYLSSMLEK